MDIIQTITGIVTLDIVIIVGVALFFTIFALQYGKGKIISFILSLYVALLVFTNFPYIEALTFFKNSELQITLSHLGIFLVLVFLIHHIINFVAYSEYPAWKGGKMFQVIILAFSATLLLLAFLYHILPISVLYDFSASIDLYFSSQFFFWWLIAPLAGVLLVSRG